MLYPDLIDVAIDTFGGYCPAIPPSDLPSGASPLAQDCIFPMGSVRQRGGLFNYFGGSPIPVNAAINGLKTYITPTLVDRLLAFDSQGNLYKESPQGTLANISARSVASGALYQSTTLFGREYIALGNAARNQGGLDIPHQYDDTNYDRVSHSGPGAAPAATDSGTAGNIVAGLHQVTVAFINRQGWISQYAPPSSYTAAGGKQVALSAIATGPPNIVARLLLFTPVITAPAVTGSFYSTPTGTQQLATPTVMVINDNVTTTATVDFLDTILIVSFQGNYLATQRTLGETAFAAGYNSRIAWLGERNRQQNFLNMDFDGGFGGTPSSTNSGLKNGTLGFNINDTGTGIVAWANPGNAAGAPDAAVASVTMTRGFVGDSYISQVLAVTGYSFAVPASATIAGVQVTITKNATNGASVLDREVALLKNGATAAFQVQGGYWPAVLGATLYGGAAFGWGLSLTPADVNASGFGAGISAYNTTNTNKQAFVDSIQITVYYTAPSASVLPLGWSAGTFSAGGGSAITLGSSGDWGDGYAITGDGVTAVRGQINQSAFTDYLGVPIISRNTAYRVRARIKAAGGLMQGVVHVNLTSASGGFTTSGIVVSVAQLTMQFQEFDFPLTDALVNPPADLLIQVYADGTPTANGTFVIDSIEPYPTSVPYNYSTAWFSHAFNPESYDNTTSAIQVRPNDGQQLHAAFPLRGDLYLAKDHYLCSVTDDGVNEPAQWSGGVKEVSATIGICGPNAVDWVEEWAAFAERSGVYLCWGSDPVDISQEIKYDASLKGKISWASVNQAFNYTIWVRIDKINKRILVGAPVNGATTPNVIFMLDYQWLTGAQDIAASPMVTYSAFTGKILAHGRGRRWSFWNIAANCMCFAERTDGSAQPFFGNGAGNGKIYEQIDAPTQLSDDGAAIDFIYQTYFAPDTMTEQALQLGGHRKLFGYLKFQATGVGNMFMTVVTSNRTSTLRSYALSTAPASDGGRPINMHSERFSITFSTNTAGSWGQLDKVILCLKKDPTIVVSGVGP